MYVEKFNKVYIVPFENIKSLNFINDIFDMHNDEIANIRYIMNKTKIINRSYSDLAMRLTFHKESLCRLLKINPNKCIFMNSKWNYLMTNIVDKVFYYSKYKLDIQSTHNIEYNIFYYDKLLEKCKRDGFLVYQK
jgi:hypothetical protein